MNDELGSMKKLAQIYKNSSIVAFLWGGGDEWPVDFVTENVIQFGYTPEDFTSGRLNYADIVHPDDLDRLRSEVLEFTKVGTTLTHEYRILTKSGEARWVTEQSYIGCDERGVTNYYQGIIIDITDRKRSEEALQLDELRLEALLKLNQMSGVSLQEITNFVREEAVRLTKSKIGYLAFVNEEENVLTLHSWSKSAMKQCTIAKKPIVYRLETTGLWGEAVRQRKPIIINDYSAPSPFKKGYPKDHIKIKRHMNAPIFDGEKIVVVAGVGNKADEYNESDVRQLTLLMQGMWKLIQQKRTEDEVKNYADELSNANKELKQNSEKLSMANEELKSLDKMKNEFLSNISHELKTPLVSIIGYTKLIDGESMGTVTDNQKKALSTVIRNSERLRHLIESLLYMSKAQYGNVEYTFDLVNTSEIIGNAIVDLKLLADNKGLTIEKQVPDDLPLINGDKDKLTNMLTNLIDNAIKFTNSGGKITLTASEEDGNLHITVNDTGIGIAKEFRPYMFKKFYQVDPSTTRRYGGTGLGLYISKHIVEVHNGKIWIESEEDVGTTVHVSIPI